MSKEIKKLYTLMLQNRATIEKVTETIMPGGAKHYFVRISLAGRRIVDNSGVKLYNTIELTPCTKQ